MNRIEVVRFVRHRDVPRYLAAGWWMTDNLRGTTHGEFSVIMMACMCNPKGRSPDV